MVDPGNTDRKFMRSIIRNDMMPHVRSVNPGIEKTFRKMILRDYQYLF